MSDQLQVAVTGAFDDPKSPTVRFLQEAAGFGEVTVLLWSDETAQQITGKPVKFPFAERAYFVGALRYVKQVLAVDQFDPKTSLPSAPGFTPAVWVLDETQTSERELCEKSGLRHQIIARQQLRGFPLCSINPAPSAVARKKVIVTGSFDWFHSGHVRFFEEASGLGDLHVVVGHDANIRLLKGEGHPLFPQEERRYLVHSIRFVSAALISSGDGWLDAAPEIERIKPDIYAVNEDGDKGGKAGYCRQHGIEYHVLKRVPAPGLAARSSTNLRGF
jgi:cytidyltransferase-like protein